MNLLPVVRQRYFDANGLPLAGGKLYTYQAGTTTPQATYTDSSGATPNANPVILDASGEANVWVDPALSYKFVLKDVNDVTRWTVDNVIGLLSNNSVQTSSLQDGSVTTIKLAANAVDSTKLLSDASVDGNRAVQTNHIRNAAVIRSKLGPVVKTKTADYTVLATDDVILVDASGGAVNLTLPAATSSSVPLQVEKTDSTTNVVTITRAGSDTIRGGTTYTLTQQYGSVTLMSDGASIWYPVSVGKAPTVQKFTSGTALTYTTPAGVRWIRVKMVGGGGGGAGSATSAAANGGGGGNGGASIFGSSLLTAGGGTGAASNVVSGGTGGSATLNAPAIGLAVAGGSGHPSLQTASPAFVFAGGQGGSSALGGAGATTYSVAGGNGVPNSGGGGGGGGAIPTTASNTGAGGGSGAYIDAIIVNPVATYTYTVGAGGTLGTAGTSGYAGGAGGSGLIVVEEFY